MINEKKNVLKEELNQNIFIFGPSLTNLDVGKRNIFPAPPIIRLDSITTHIPNRPQKEKQLLINPLL